MLATIHQCTEVHFASFLSSIFITAIVVNPLEKNLVKRTSVPCAGSSIAQITWNNYNKIRPTSLLVKHCFKCVCVYCQDPQSWGCMAPSDVTSMKHPSLMTSQTRNRKSQWRVNTEGPCLIQLLGLGKSHISQISLLRFALCKFWSVYFISAIFWLFCPKNHTTLRCQINK